MDQLEELQHFAELGRLSASLLHEISNPLTAALLELDQSDQHVAGVRHARRSLQLLRRYVEAARQQVSHGGVSAGFAVRPQLEQLKRVLLPLARAAGVQLSIEPAPDCRLYGDAVKFQHILANLISNAIDAYRHDTATGLARPVHVRLSQGAHSLNVQVIDWGEGISVAQLPLLFEPFYTTKSQTGHGLGIGLFMVRQYVTLDFQGSIRVTSSRRHGTQFSFKLPLA